MFSLSRFAQLMQFLPRDAFQKAVDKHRGDRYTKNFRCWDQTVAMIYAQMEGVSSLRELETGFNQHRNHHYHLGTAQVSRSTLGDANKNRNPEVFAEVVRLLIQKAGSAVRKQRDEMLYLLDSTSIALRGRGSEWTKKSATRTPGLKVHILYASGAQFPVHHTITAANVNDIDEGRKMPIQRGATYVFDKGYCDYAWWARIGEQGARFVTRLKSNAAVRVESSNAVSPEDAQHILSDQIISFVYRSNRGKHRNLFKGTLRRVEVARADDKPLIMVTNDHEAPASQIAQLYKDRWQIELFFKWIKQHLKIKSFLGESKNAVTIQLLTALIAYLLVVLYKKANALPQTLWEVLAELRTGIFLCPQPEKSRWRKRRENEAIRHALQPGLFT
ncbi:MAG TPA: IS4 family transposase [Ramlibacter sp.]|nr:IS4 family transposase [Ramlibacter sp.]